MHRPKQFAIEIMSSRPVYRALPPGAVRTYAALRYHGRHSSREEITRRVRAIGGIPTGFLSTAVVAAQAAFHTGQDDLLRDTLTELERRFPEAPAVPQLRCDLHTYYGRYEQALRSAEQARTLEPASPSAAARVVRLAYRVVERATADQWAVAAVQRFPRNGEVLWAACLACESPEQYERLQHAWDASVPEPAGLLKAVRPLANAATRAGRLDAALAHYHRAIELLAASKRPAKLGETTLAGRGAGGAIEDLCRVLDGAGVRFFFAAGTALGLIREGRPLGADGDIDVGIFDADWDRDALVALFTADPRFDPLPHPLTDKLGLRHRGGSPVDVFRFYAQDGRVWHDGVFVRWWNSPFEVARREIGGVSVPLPADPERYLTENYGESWRTPWPGFDAFTDDAPNLEVTWPEYQRLHFLRRAYKRLAAGDRAGAGHELHRAAEEELATRTGLAQLARLGSPLAPLPEPGTQRAQLADAQVQLARQARAEGDHEAAVHILERALQVGLWSYARLWSELRSLMRHPGDYARIRSLWLDSPRSCQNQVPVIQAVARAASAAGEQVEARVLLRKAILLKVRQTQRLRGTVGRRVRRVEARLRPAPARAAASFEQRAAAALTDLNRELGELGVRGFLISGTLLGYLRDGGFISWDKDIDLGIFTEEISPPELEKAFDRSATFDVRRLDFNSDRLRVNHRNGVMIDIFPHYREPHGEGDRIWHDGSATRWWNSPFELTTVEFLGARQYVPDPPERYLTENYGDWRVPRPDFDARLDTPNVEVTDPDLLHTLLYFSLLDALHQGKRARRRRYVQLLRERGDDGWLTRL